MLQGDDTKESVQQVIDLMDSYDLRREDWDSIMEISKWEGMHDETSSISSKVFPKNVLFFSL